jgi:hypothetical protein
VTPAWTEWEVATRLARLAWRWTRATAKAAKTKKGGERTWRSAGVSGLWFVVRVVDVCLEHSLCWQVGVLAFMFGWAAAGWQAGKLVW